MENIDAINVEPPLLNCHCGDVKLSQFSELSENKVRQLIESSSNATCLLDPLPTWLFKVCIDALASKVTDLVNHSLTKGYVPDQWKTALVTPLQKKVGSDTDFKNYRPVSNLPFISKIVEKAVVDQLLRHCEENALLPDCQSAYRRFSSTETALLKVQNDILLNMDKQEVTLLVLLDLSAAFDTVDHSLLLNTLERDFGVTDTALLWFQSYLSERKQCIVIENNLSDEFNLSRGIPQGSCLGPVLFLLYGSKLFEVIRKHFPSAHAFADDTQIYFSFKPESQLAQDNAVSTIEKCVADICAWMVSYRLMINDSKTEFLIIGSRGQLSKININSVMVGDSIIELVKSTRNLGSWFDEHMAMDIHIGHICNKAFKGLYNIRQIRTFLSTEATKILIHAFATSHLDYCNSRFWTSKISTGSAPKSPQRCS